MTIQNKLISLAKKMEFQIQLVKILAKIATENKKTGLTMQPSDWRQIDLRTANGSALWIDKTSASCGDLVNVHASLYGPKNSDKQTEIKTIHAWRIGWYNGSGARDVWQSQPIKLKRFGFSKPRLGRPP
jgi:hypothetical protein